MNEAADVSGNHRDEASPAASIPTVGELARLLRGVKWMGKNQGRWVTAEIHRRGYQRVVEIGTLHGAGTCYLAAAVAANDGHVDTFDLPESAANVPSVEVSLARCGLTPYVTIHRDPRGSGVLADWPAASVDLVYVDGDHSRAGCDRDIANGVRILKPGGLLLVDDVTHRKYGAAIAASWKAALGQYPLQPLSVPIRQWVAAERLDVRPF